MRYPFNGKAVDFSEWIHTKWSDLFPGRFAFMIIYQFINLSTHFILSCLGRPLLGIGDIWLLPGSSEDWICYCVCLFTLEGKIIITSYVLSQSTPFISSLYAIFLWKEFKIASKKTWMFESLMLITMAISVLFLCLAKSSN